MPWRKQINGVVLFVLALVVGTVVALVFLSVTEKSTVIGREIMSLQSDMAKLERDKADVQGKLANLNSSETMEKRALALGFKPVNPEDTTYLVVPGYAVPHPAVLGPHHQAELAAAPVLPATYTESLWVWMQRKLAHSRLAFWEVQP
jgi:cell division protein FtsB